MTVELKLRDALLVAALIAGLQAVPQHARAAATITVLNLDGPGEGFNDPTPAAPVGGNPGTTLGAQRLNAFQFAANIWGAILDSGVAISVGATFDPLPCSATLVTLGAAGTEYVVRDFPGALRAATWYSAALANKLAGFDLVPTFDDIGALFNSSLGTTCPFPSSWYFGLDRTPPAGRIDFVTVVLHELSHGLGFYSAVDDATGAKLDGFDDAYMVFLEDHTTGLTYPAMTDAQRVAASVNTGNLHWVGPRVVAKSTGLTAGRHAPSGHVEMFAPSPLSGSSVSHFSTSLTPNDLMEPTYTGPNHSVGLSAWLLDDIGWNVAVPDVAAVWGKLKPSCDSDLCFIRGEFFVRNLGTETAPATTARIYHSANSVFDAGDPLIVTVPIGALPVGQAQRQKLDVDLPGVVNPANSFLFAIADDGNAVAEGDETNNAAPFAFGPTP